MGLPVEVNNLMLGSLGGYTVGRSLRFRSSASAYLNRTASTSPTSQTTGTFSFWVKRGLLSTATPRTIFGFHPSRNCTIEFDDQGFNNSYSFRLVDETSTSGTYNAVVASTAVFRDPSAWYHFVLTIDTTQATASNRVKMYVNGVQLTSFTGTLTYPSLNASMSCFQGGVNYIGARNGPSQYFDGYLAESYYIDGQALTPSSFGAYDTNGVWQPKKYTGTYGTNGFYLPFTSNTTATYAGSFNGSTQSLSVPASSNLSLGTGDFTLEAWVMPFTTSGIRPIFESRSSNASANGYAFGVNGSNQLFLFSNSTFLLTSSATLSANVWYHVALVRSGSTATMYINGVSSGSVTFTANLTDPSTNITRIGFSTSPEWWNGYISNARIVKGTAVYTANFTPSASPLTAITNTQLLTLQNSTIIDNSANAFTITNNNSVAVSVQYPFTTGSSISNDASGNGNNWTPNNISLTAGTTYDSMVDSPTVGPLASNYAVLNPLDNTGNTLSEGNLKVTGAIDKRTLATIGMTSGKWYCEATIGSFTTCVVGVTRQVGATSYIGSDANSWGYENSGNKWNNNSASAYGASYTTNDVIGIAFDADAGTLTFYKNNTSQGTAFSGLTNGPYFFAVGSNAPTAFFNFGQRPFSYTPPSGYKALNTYNLPAPSIANGAQYMAATLWSGNNVNGTAISNSQSNGGNNPLGTTFAPDLVWVKSRSGAYYHMFQDTIRGAGKSIFSNVTDAESGNSGDLLGAFQSTGFTVNRNYTGQTTNPTTNNSGDTYVGWQWKAGGTGVTNTAGTITSTVSANTTAGFSVVTYTGNGSGALASVAHGLGVTPKMIILKNRTSATNWSVYHANLTSAFYYLLLNSTAAQASDSGYWGGTPPDAGQFYIYGTSGSYTNVSGANYVAYCFSAVRGYSAFGSYTGNGSSDGPFVFTNFRPRFVMIKRTDAANFWLMMDTSRNTYNVMGDGLLANTSGAEFGWNPSKDILSNGFKIRTSDVAENASGGTYIYAAFAENPFNISRAR